MRANRTIFWISIITGICCVVFIVLFGCLAKSCSKQEALFTALENVFISLIGGAFLSGVAAYISFLTSKRRNIIKFSSEITNVINMIKGLANWFTWDYGTINYGTEKSELDLIYDRKVEKCYKILKEIVEYDYDRIYEILDDFCSLIHKNKKYKLRNQMKNILSLVQDYNVLHSKKEAKEYSRYEQDRNNYLFYKEVIVNYETKVTIEDISNLLNERQKFVDETKINEYLDKIYKDDK